MRGLTDGVRWNGIGGPSDGKSDKTFAQRVREAMNKNYPAFKWEQKGGHAAAKRGTSAWHIYGYTLPERVEAPADATADVTCDLGPHTGDKSPDATRPSAATLIGESSSTVVDAPVGDKRKRDGDDENDSDDELP